MNATGENDESPLHLAAKSGQREVVAQLLSDEIGNRNTILNSQDSKLNTALHLAAENGYAPICRDLIEKGADVALVNHGSESAFELAVKEGHLECVEIFCEKCDPNKPFLSGLAPLHLAVKFGHEILVVHLLLKGAKIDQMTHGMWPRNAFEIALDGENM